MDNGSLSEDYIEELKGLISDRWKDIWNTVNAREERQKRLSQNRHHSETH